MSTRHTAFFIEYSNGNNVLTHITGSSGFFEHEERWNTAQPSDSRHYERTIEVATCLTNDAETAVMKVRNTLYTTNINNEERSWNCQSWIGDGLADLKAAGLLSETAVNRAVDVMTDVLMEAPDED